MSSTTGTSLIGGEAAPTDMLQATVAIEGRCTGAKIGPRHILFAAHCVTALDDGGHAFLPRIDPAFADGARIRVTDANDLRGVRWSYLTVTHAYVHPEWFATCALSGCGFDHSIQGTAPPDVAIVETKETVPGATAVVDGSPVEPNTDVVIAGYGCEQSVDTPSPGERLKFARTRTLGRIKSMGGYVGIGYFETPGIELGGEASLCPGDSGGPVYRAEGDTTHVVGVNAYYTFNDANGVSATNVHTRLTGGAHDVLGWIERIVRGDWSEECLGLDAIDPEALPTTGSVRLGALLATVRARCSLFGEAPSMADLHAWAERYSSGRTPADYVSDLFASAAGVATYGDASDLDFVRAVWRHGMGKELYGDWALYYAHRLETGDTTRAEFVAFVADSEYVRARIDPRWL
ncbi:MAG: trypsin-like serine protease [Polyangiales bacterium]|nr:trypsin-like serine protease [Myxococcales bacterium]